MINRSGPALFALVGIFLICACACCAAGAGGLTWLTITTLGDSFQELLRSALGEDAQMEEAEAATPEAILRPTISPLSLDSVEDPIARITAARLPREDLAELAIRFKGVPPDAARVNCPALAPGYDVGATRTFTLSNADTDEMFAIEARLEHKGEHVYMWVQSAPERVRLAQAKLSRAAQIFDQQIYPRTRAFFGSEAQPGVDCDLRIHVVHAKGIGRSVGGYFSAPDAYPRAVRSDSNEGEVFIMHAEAGYNGADPGSETYLSTLAHEFQHMISFHQTHAPELWLEEGAAQFAERLNGYEEAITTIYDFAAAPHTQLNAWRESSAGGNSAHYGASYLFWAYIYDRFGEAITRQFARSPERSTRALMDILAANDVVNPDTGGRLSFEDLFADFVIANYMGKEVIEVDKRFHYTTVRVPPMAIHASLAARDYPFFTRQRLAQFGTHYYKIEGESPVTVVFTGSTAVALLPTDQADGMFWWSNRADVSNPRLTRAVDLTGVSGATLTYRAWYRLERNYDYAYVTVSADGGRTWAILSPTSCTRENPQNANLGCGYNGASGGDDDAPRWLNEQVSLDEFAGQRILLRFEMVTDAAINREGLAIDDIAIPEIGFFDDGSAEQRWESEGWVRVGNLLPQRWRVQAIVTQRDGQRRLQRLSLVDGIGQMTFDFARDVRSVVLAISPVTQVTTEPAAYELRISYDGR
jgi:immune inhibitor A